MTILQPSVIWTRSLEDAALDRGLWAGLNVTVHALPCLKTEGLPFTIPDRTYAVAVITSRKAAAYAARDVRLSEILRKCSVYTFGAGTAQDLRSFGCSVLQASQARGAEELAQIMVNTVPAGEPILVIGALEPHYDLANHFKAAGHETHYLAIYRTAVGLEIDEKKRVELINNLSGVVCFGSPSAVKGFAMALKPKANRLSHELLAVAIGPATLNSAKRHFHHCQMAPRSSVAALFETAFSAAEHRVPAQSG